MPDGPATEAQPCPLCGGRADGASWLGATRFDGERFDYVRCGGCGSLFVEPMPSPTTLAVMYGPGYAVASTTDADEPRADDRVLAVLAERPIGTFVDHGCGEGALLQRVARAGWQVLGVELDTEVARAIAAATGLEVLDRARFLEGDERADVLHLGDVVEHLTRPLDELAAVLDRLRPGGLVLAQGPLEGNRNLFVWLLAVSRRVGGTRPADQPPYHVVLATAAGQRRLFARAGLVEERFDVTEVAWPAPATWRQARRQGGRGVAMYAVRRASMLLSSRRPDWGNRYFYVGRKP